MWLPTGEPLPIQCRWGGSAPQLALPMPPPVPEAHAGVEAQPAVHEHVEAPPAVHPPANAPPPPPPLVAFVTFEQFQLSEGHVRALEAKVGDLEVRLKHHGELYVATVGELKAEIADLRQVASGVAALEHRLAQLESLRVVAGSHNKIAAGDASAKLPPQSLLTHNADIAESDYCKLDDQWA